MTAPRLAQATDHGRMYSRTRGGHPVVPSITTVLDALNPRLEWWESLCTINETLQHIRAVNDVMSLPDGPEFWARRNRMKDFLMGAAERDRNESADRGDFVHNYAEVFALEQMGRATSADVQEQLDLCKKRGVEQYLAHFHEFWWDFAPRPILPEATVWNHTERYAGTTDLICEIDTSEGPLLTVLDFKTKKALFKRNGQRKDSDLRAYTAMQLVAAAMAEEYWVEGETPDQDRWEPWTFQPDIGLAVAFGPDGYAVRQYDIYDPLVWESFRALRQVWDWESRGEAVMSDRIEQPADLKRLTPAPNHVSTSW